MDKFNYPLMENNVTREDIDSLVAFLSQDPLPRFTNGPKVAEFENQWGSWQGTSYNTMVGSGSVANEISILALKTLYPDGGEILVSPLGWVSDVSAILQAGFTPVFVDINLKNFSMDSEHLAKKITPRSRAILLVHVLGLNGLNDDILNIAKENNLCLIEDCCLPAGEKIITQNGFRAIESLIVGDKVLTHTGRFQAIKAVMRRNYAGKLCRFYTYGSDIRTSTTDNHPILCSKTNNICIDRKLEWTRADMINKGDYLVFPRYKVYSDIDTIDISHIDGSCSNSKFKKEFENRIVNNIPINDDMLSLIGWYLAEGSKSKAHIQFSLSKAETENIGNLIAIIERLGFKSGVYDNPLRPTVEVCLYSKQMTEWLLSEFGDSSYSKRIPPWVLNLSDSKLRNLLFAYAEGDGCKVKNRKSQYSITSVSLDLFNSIKIICSKLGYYCGITQTTTEGVSTIKDRVVNVADKYQLRFSTLRNNPNDRRVYIDDNYFYVRVRDIEEVDFDGEVYNFEVDEDHSYCSPAWTMHNCESHGATYKGVKVGNYGDINNFSFFFAHHLCSLAEGGMIGTKSEEIHNIVRALRSHGMVREMPNSKFREKVQSENPELNPDFIFFGASHNGRSQEVNAVVALNQLKRLDINNAKRAENFNYFMSGLNGHKYLTDLAMEGNSNYAFIIVLKNFNKENWLKVESALKENNIEFRRGLSGGGSQVRQPYLKLWGYHIDPSLFPNTEHVHYCSAYVGNYPTLDRVKIDKLLEVLNNLDV